MKYLCWNFVKRPSRKDNRTKPRKIHPPPLSALAQFRSLPAYPCGHIIYFDISEVFCKKCVRPFYEVSTLNTSLSVECGRLLWTLDRP